MAERRRLSFFDIMFDDKISTTVKYIEKNGLCFKRVLGTGAFGCVVNMENPKDKSNVAVKIIHKQPDVDGEIHIWRSLQHKNILKLISCNYISSVDSYIFVTPVYPITLIDRLLQKDNSIKFYVAVRWLKDISDAFSYLHSRKLWYLDLKPNNILLSKSQKAIVCDFGFLTVGDKPVNHYGSPRLYGPPEAWNRGVLSKVDGYSFDVWRIGMLAVEIFTRMSLLNEANKWSYPLTEWISTVYPMLQRILIKEQFLKLVIHGFSPSEARKKVDDALNFIKLCLNVIPEKRPEAQQLLTHRLLGGCLENIEPQQPENDIWKKALKTSEVEAIIEKYKSDIAIQNSNEKFMSNEPVMSAPKAIKSANYFVPLFNEDVRSDGDSTSVVEVDALLDKSNNEISDFSDDLCLDWIFDAEAKHSSSWVSIIGSGYFSDTEVEVEDELKLESDDSSSFGLETLFDDVSITHKNELPLQSFKMESDDNVSKITSKQGNTGKNQKMNRCYRLRSWWNRGKSVCCQILICCLPCVKKKKKSQQHK